MSRKNAREHLMKLLYQMDLNNDYSDDMLNLFIKNEKINNNEIVYIIDGVKKIKENIDLIDKKIEKNTRGWSLNRIAKVDLAIIRLSIYEIFYREDIPIEVSINEALELGKKYSNADSYKFINGLLGGIVREKDEER